ncbi:hypothetical protein OAR26_02585 [Candidatus Marinimicrobia bacterium]|nr:hypothetical protein [Candidatus Neomarinimicrobiota bacterium]
MKQFFQNLFDGISLIIFLVLYFSVYFVAYGSVILLFFSVWEFIIRQPMFTPDSSVWDVIKAFFGIWWELINEYIFWSLNPVNWYKWFTSINWI